MWMSHYTQTDQTWSVETWFICMTMAMVDKETDPRTIVDANLAFGSSCITYIDYHDIWQFLPTFTMRTPGAHSRNYWVSVIKKTNQMANGTLNFDPGNGNWWRLSNHERKLLISLNVGKYGWEAVGSYAFWFGFMITHSGVNFWCPYCKCWWLF